MQQQATESYHCCGSRSSSCCCCCCGFAPPCSPPPAPCPSSSSSCFPPLLPTLFPPLLPSLFFSSCRCFLSLLPLLLLTPSLPRSPSLLLAPPFIPPSPPGSANHTQPRETRKIQATWPGPERPRGTTYIGPQWGPPGSSWGPPRPYDIVGAQAPTIPYQKAQNEHLWCPLGVLLEPPEVVLSSSKTV